ncbi:hypothetical protein BV25DRAFT_1989825 [Artomyces pyxidatus]|uniref:Uncharacterized protein n=1 Tax=Artomyces pyxidatus TaxID=48021 RepID=A0ACB8T7Y3_9AGAM|nr:hypothetical protein BV25DRAFT_1989825 [Artomyces pyxidatus]
MPRKSSETPAPRAATSAIRAPRAAASKKKAVDDQFVDDAIMDFAMDEDDVEEGEEDEEPDSDNGEEQLLTMLQELRKKSTKSSSLSSARHKQVSAACTQYRQHTDAFVRDSNAYIDKIVSDALEMADTSGDAARALSEGARQWGDTYAAIKAANALTPITEGNLPSRRAEDVNTACARVEAFPVLQKKSHRRLLRMVREELGRLLEEEQNIPLPLSSVLHHLKVMAHSPDKVLFWNGKQPVNAGADTKQDSQDVVTTASSAEPTLCGLPLKYISLVTLAVQNAALTLLMHYSRVSTPPSRAYSAASAVLATELLKGLISLVIAFTRVEDHSPQYTLALPSPLPQSHCATSALNPRVFLARCRILGKEVFRQDCWKLSIPAILYVIQNNLQFVAASNLEAATFQVSYQMKILTTAAFSVFLLRRKLSPLKWLALFFLALGVGIVQIQSGAARGLISSEASSDDVHTMVPFKGFVAVAAACFTSGLAGVYFEMVLKNSSGDLWVRNVQLSLFSLLPALVPVFLAPSPSPNAPAHSVPSITHLFANFTPWAWATVLTQVFGGLITALVIKYADNIMKGFATSLSIVISFLASVALFHFRITASFIVGASVVLAATWLYSQPDGKRVPFFRARRSSAAADLPFALASTPSSSSSVSSSGSSSPSATFATMAPLHPYPTYPTRPMPLSLVPSLGRRTPSQSPFSSPTTPTPNGRIFTDPERSVPHLSSMRSHSMPSILLPDAVPAGELRQNATI